MSLALFMMLFHVASVFVFIVAGRIERAEFNATCVLLWLIYGEVSS